MRKFVKKIMLFVLLFVLSANVIFWFDFWVIGNQHLGSYQAALIDKVNRMKEITDPKIILIGHSNLAFGVNSQEIEDTIGMPVVNMGMHGGLGNAFHENIVKLGVNPGDIVIICHSDYDDDDKIPQPTLAWITIEKHTDLWPIIRLRDYFDMVRAYPDYFKDEFVLWIGGGKDNVPKKDTCYSRAAFNAYGDIINRPPAEYEFIDGAVIVPCVGKGTVRRINDLNDYLVEKGAVLLIAGYPIGYGQYTPSADEYSRFEEELRENVNCEVISHYPDYFLTYDNFYDTNLHLSDEGVELRTHQLICDIQKWMVENNM